MYGNTFFNTSELPKTVWVEIVTPSSQLRDVVITAYCGVEPRAADTVNATGVWATLTAVAHENAEYEDLMDQPEWATISEPPHTRALAVGGTGLRPIPIRLAGEEWAGNAIWMQFTVTPPGIQDEWTVLYDAARRAEYNLLGLDGSWQIATPSDTRRYPDQNEEANDDSNEDDESVVPNSYRQMFTIDAPGAKTSIPADVKYLVHYFNAEEYLRVAFGAGPPGGNTLTGTRASPKVEWKVFHTLEVDDTGQLERTSGDDVEVPGENEVSLGRIEDLGDPDQAPPRPW